MFHVKHVCVLLVLPSFCKESRRLFSDAPERFARCVLNAGAGALVGLPLLSVFVYKNPRACPNGRAHGGLFVAFAKIAWATSKRFLCLVSQCGFENYIYIGWGERARLRVGSGAKGTKKILDKWLQFW